MYEACDLWHTICKRERMTDMANKFTKQNFETEVLQSDIPVLVDFYADWCGPCKMMSPVVDSLATELANSIKVGKVNVDEEPALSQDYRVVSIPTFLLIKDGQVKDTIVGAISADKLRDKIKQILA